MGKTLMYRTEAWLASNLRNYDCILLPLQHSTLHNQPLPSKRTPATPCLFFSLEDSSHPYRGSSSTKSNQSINQSPSHHISPQIPTHCLSLTHPLTHPLFPLLNPARHGDKPPYCIQELIQMTAVFEFEDLAHIFLIISICTTPPKKKHH